MPTEEYEAAYRRIIEAVNAGDFGAPDALFAADIVDNPVPGQVPGLTGFKQVMATARRSFPDRAARSGTCWPKANQSPGVAPSRGRRGGSADIFGELGALPTLAKLQGSLGRLGTSAPTRSRRRMQARVSIARSLAARFSWRPAGAA
jgi:hypothetical protein